MLFSKSDISSKIIEKSNKIKSLKEFVNFFTNVVNYTFKKENSKINNKDFISTVTTYIFYLNFKLKKKEMLQELAVNLMQLEDNLKYTKEILYFILFSLNCAINYAKFSEYDENSEDKNKHFDKFVNTVDLMKNFIWVFYEQTYNNKNNKKYTEYAYVGTKLYEKEKLPINIFETIDKKDNNKPIDAYIGKSLFNNIEIIIIKLNIEYFKKFKINIEELKKDINTEIELMNKPKNFSTYIIIGKKLVMYPQSYDLFLQELLENKVYKEEEIAEEKKKIKENKTIMQNNKEDKCKSVDLKEYHSEKQKDIRMTNDNTQMENLENLENLEINELKNQLNNEKSKNKELEEKIFSLENKLKEEKMRCDEFKSEITKIKSELNNEIEKYKNLTEKLKFKEEYKDNSSSESKDKLLEKLFESEKEIKEIKSKLSRFPFELNEGEKMLCLIFTSCDQKLHYPIICKNSEQFNIVENRLYEKFSEYKEYENYFTFNGNKVNKYLTIEENKIRYGDNILLNIIDE